MSSPMTATELRDLADSLFHPSVGSELGATVVCLVLAFGAVAGPAALRRRGG